MQLNKFNLAKPTQNFVISTFPNGADIVFSLAAGDNGGSDSVFSDPMRLDINHDSGPADGNHLYGDLTKDSGVGRSPRAPGSGSDPRSLGDSSVPPAWLQDVSVGSVKVFLTFQLNNVSIK